MTLVFLAVAAAGLPVVLYGQHADRQGTTGTGRGTAALRGVGAAALYGGLCGFALGLLDVPATLAAVAALGVGGGGAYLRILLVRLAGEPERRPRGD